MRIWILILGSKGVKQNVLGRLSKVTLLCQLKIIVYTITQVFFLLHFCIPPNKFPRKGYVWSRYCLSKKSWDWFSTGRFANRQYPALLGMYEFKNFNQTSNASSSLIWWGYSDWKIWSENVIPFTLPSRNVLVHFHTKWPAYCNRI